MSPASARPSSPSWRAAPSPPSKPLRINCAPDSAPSSPSPCRRPAAGSCSASTASFTSRSDSAIRPAWKPAMCCPNCAASPLNPEEEKVLESLRAEVLEANLELVRRGLVIFTFGNASAVSREHSLCVIKPSGVPYNRMTPADMVITDLEGNLVEGSLRPSSDLATHVALYRSFPEIGGVVHTHSRHATAWAHANREVPCFGTPHHDSLHAE